MLVVGAGQLLGAQDASQAAAPNQAGMASGLPGMPPGQAGATYVGSDTCKACHEELFNKLQSSPHWQTMLKSKFTGEGHGCESCHGPGSLHVEGGGDKTKIFTFKGAKPEVASERCMTCHEAKPEQGNFLRSVHNENGVSCNACHSVHATKAEYQLVSKQPSLCFSCHKEQKVDFQKPFRHRVEEGLIKCTDCHNPHGSLRVTQLRSTPNQDLVCLKCHSDKRGPFVYEHEPVRVEGCQACHTPHASVYPRMLLTARVNTLCLQCHVQIPTGVHGPQNQFRQTCIICHNSIHGSNLSDIFFK
jgi:DmsE family decaheme c-type cytochrome